MSEYAAAEAETPSDARPARALAPAAAPGGGAPPGPVKIVGNALFAGADFEDTKRRLHLGCGTNHIAGWLNVDGDAGCSPNMVMDLRSGIDLPDDSVDFIFSEHFFEHMTLPQAVIVFAECARVLRPGGIMRTAMPNLADAVRFYLGQWRDQAWLQSYPQIDTAAHMLNVTLREWGHLYVYDYEDLSLRLTQAGFVDVLPEQIGMSRHPALRGLETRPESTLITEATVT